MNQIGKSKLVFVLNGTSSALVDPVMQGIKSLNGMEDMLLMRVDKTEELFDVCKQSVAANSDCFAAVIFSEFNDQHVNYTIAANNIISTDQVWTIPFIL